MFVKYNMNVLWQYMFKVVVLVLFFTDASLWQDHFIIKPCLPPPSRKPSSSDSASTSSGLCYSSSCSCFPILKYRLMQHLTRGTPPPTHLASTAAPIPQHLPPTHQPISHHIPTTAPPAQRLHLMKWCRGWKFKEGEWCSTQRMFYIFRKIITLILLPSISIGF